MQQGPAAGGGGMPQGERQQRGEAPRQQTKMKEGGGWAGGGAAYVRIHVLRRARSREARHERWSWGDARQVEDKRVHGVHFGGYAKAGTSIVGEREERRMRCMGCLCDGASLSPAAGVERVLWPQRELDGRVEASCGTDKRVLAPSRILPRPPRRRVLVVERRCEAGGP